MTDDISPLKKRILEEMKVDGAGALEQHFEVVKTLVKLTPTGRVVVLDKERYGARDQVMLYLLGKLYGGEAGLSQKGASNEELMIELGLPEGTVRPRLKELRDARLVATTADGGESLHHVPSHMIERAIQSVTLRNKAK